MFRSADTIITDHSLNNSSVHSIENDLNSYENCCFEIESDDLNPTRCFAVQVKNGFFGYDRGRNSQSVLKGINFNVPEGKSYGLLGPSGCGKTTLLKIVVGSLNLRNGQVIVFGRQPGSENSIVPGRGVGFMPQELALLQDLTIPETLNFFGKLNGLEKDFIKSRTEFLIKFLDLPGSKQKISQLSGGQQRRVSLGVALIHNPPLLILDEPTVGLDPTLRRNIWNYLNKLNSEGTTVIITTHYVEEAKQANIVGLMRQGVILEEGNPFDLMSRHQENTLEGCFLKLCHQEGNRKDEFKNMENDSPARPKLFKRFLTREAETPTYPPTRDDLKLRQRHQGRKKTFQDDYQNILTIFQKNLLVIRRNVILVLLQFFVPMLQIFLFYFCFGQKLTGLNLAVVNQEISGNLSRSYLSKLNSNIVQNSYSSIEDALDSVRKGQNWGYIHMSDNFSEAIIEKITEGIDAKQDLIATSGIKVRLDMTNIHIADEIQTVLFDAYKDFSQELFVNLGATPHLADLPAEEAEPIYGDESFKYTDQVLPGMVIYFGFMMSVALTMVGLIAENRSGLYRRNVISGVTSDQVLISMGATQCLILLIHVFTLATFTLFYYESLRSASSLWVILLIWLQGLIGLAYGLILSAVFDDEGTAMMFALGLYYPLILFSSIVWPTESMVVFLRYISLVCPPTLPIKSLRAIVSKGLGITHILVWPGFFISIIWLIILIVVAIFIFRRKK